MVNILLQTGFAKGFFFLIFYFDCLAANVFPDPFQKSNGKIKDSMQSFIFKIFF